MQSASFVRILGARGSVPVGSAGFSAYGGATTCVHVRLAGQDLILDAGTGFINLPSELLSRKKLPLLLTHPHLDHINGLSMSPYVMSGDCELDIYAAEYNGVDLEHTLLRLYSPPIWPILPSDFAATLRYLPLADFFSVGAVKVRSMDGVHPGGVKLFRLDGGGKSVVFATDCTLTEALYPMAVRFAEGCDLLLCDGQYSDDEWLSRSGYGHNTWKTAARFGLDCGARALRIVHHDPTHNDAALDAARDEVRRINPFADLGLEGEVIPL